MAAVYEYQKLIHFYQCDALAITPFIKSSLSGAHLQNFNTHTQSGRHGIPVGHTNISSVR